jgi:hypothetical protein
LFSGTLIAVVLIEQLSPLACLSDLHMFCSKAVVTQSARAIQCELFVHDSLQVCDTASLFRLQL